jgi:hypothetical protein
VESVARKSLLNVTKTVGDLEKLRFPRQAFSSRGIIYLCYAVQFSQKVSCNSRFLLQNRLCGRLAGFSGDSGRTSPVFGQLQVAHQAVGQLHEADLDRGTGHPDGADELDAHAVVHVHRRDLEGANELVLGVDGDVVLVTEVAFTVLFCPARLDILLLTLGFVK